MLEDMAMRGQREATQRDYVRFVQSFATFLRPLSVTQWSDAAPAKRTSADLGAGTVE